MAASHPQYFDDWDDGEDGEQFEFYHIKCPDGVVLADDFIIFPKDLERLAGLHVRVYLPDRSYYLTVVNDINTGATDQVILPDVIENQIDDQNTKIKIEVVRIESTSVIRYKKYKFRSEKLSRLSKHELTGTYTQNVTRLDLPIYAKSNSLPSIPKNKILSIVSGPDSAFLSNLPVVRQKTEIIKAFDENRPIIVLKSGTGTGKSLGLVHMLLEHSYNNHKKCLLLIGEPKRFAVLKATETLQKFYSGPKIAYHMRNDSNYVNFSNCVFLTSGILFQIMKTLASGEMDCSITHIFIDEAHDLENDNNLCLRLIPEVLKKYPNIKFVVMSATLDIDEFVHFFKTFNIPEESIKTIEIPGVVSKLTINYSNINRPIFDTGIPYDEIRENVYNYIRSSNFQEAILIFLPGESEISKCIAIIESDEHFKDQPINFIVLSRKTLHCVDFSKKPRATRTIYVATNIAESSVTLTDVGLVLDSGFERCVIFDDVYEGSRVSIRRIDKNSAIQRAGRAGRVKEGQCIRMYSEEIFNGMPNCKRIDASNIDEICLKTLDLGVDPVKFLTSLIHPISKTFQRLLKLNLVQKNDSFYSLTNLGECVLDLPVDISEAIAIIFGITFKCLDPILSIIFSGREYPFFDETGKAKDTQMVQNSKTIASIVNARSRKNESDHLVLSTLFDHVSNFDDDKVHNILKTNASRISKNSKLKLKLLSKLQKKFKFDNFSEVNTYRENPDMIRFCLAGALKTKIAFKDSFGALYDHSTAELLELASTSFVTQSPDFYCYGRKIVTNDSMA